MASGAENNQPRNQEQQSGRHSQSDQPPVVSNYPPSGGNVNYNPSAMYPQQPYPGVPPQGYPGYGAYSPYPPAAYAQDPAVAYYATQQYSHADDQGGNACFRCICLIMLMSLMLTVIASIVFFFVAKPDQTTFKVENLSVSNFSTNKVVTGKWDVEFSLETGRRRLNIEKLVPSLYQKDTWLADGWRSTSSTQYWEDWTWGNAHYDDMRFKFEVNNATAPAAEMEKEIKEAGGVTFTLILNVNYQERSSGLWWHYKGGTMKVTCKDLKIGLAVGANSGTLNGGKKDCEVSR